MKFALVNGQPQEAQPSLSGECRFCGSPMVAKCGETRVWHWAHKGRLLCDPWWENETEWHRAWKNQFPADWQEVIPHRRQRDVFEAIGVGQRGADVLQSVKDGTGAVVGKILWEGKSTKVFSDKWLAKLREDQRASGAASAVLVTRAMPEGVPHFGQRERVWIACPAAAIALAHLLRQALLEVARARVAGVNQNEKQAALYEYLSGIEFKQRVEAILDPLLVVLDQQQRERRALEAGWAKNEKAMRQAIVSVAVLYGNVNGIIGGTLPRIERLELPPAQEDQAA